MVEEQSDIPGEGNRRTDGHLSSSLVLVLLPSQHLLNAEYVWAMDHTWVFT